MGRILKDKGIFEYIEAEKLLKKNSQMEFFVVGPKDYENPKKLVVLF